MSSPSVKEAGKELIVVESIAIVNGCVKGAVVVEDSRDAVDCASDAKVPVAVVAGVAEGEDAAEGASVAGDGKSAEADDVEISCFLSLSMLSSSFGLGEGETERWLCGQSCLHHCFPQLNHPILAAN